VENFKILKETKTNKGTWEYEVQFAWMTSGEPTGTTGAKLTVKQDGQNWYISQIHNDDNIENRMEGEGGGLRVEVETVEVDNDDNIENRMEGEGDD